MGFTNDANTPVNNNTTFGCTPQSEGTVIQNVESNEEEPPEGKTFENNEVDGEEIVFNCPAFSYLNPKVKCKRGATGSGLYAVEPLKKNEMILGWSGKVVHVNQVIAMDESERTYILQIDEELFQVPFWKGYNEAADFVNHSCDPNAGFRNSPIVLGAIRDIKVGEQISFDYAMCECVNGLKGNEFECQCGTQYCRGKFTGADWQDPKLWERYGNYFSPYLLTKIDMLQKAQQSQQKEKVDSDSRIDVSATTTA